MPIFNLSAAVTCSVYTDVEADTLEEAIQIALDRPVELRFNGSGTYPDDVWCLEEADGEVQEVRNNA